MCDTTLARQDQSGFWVSCVVLEKQLCVHETEKHWSSVHPIAKGCLHIAFKNAFLGSEEFYCHHLHQKHSGVELEFI